MRRRGLGAGEERGAAQRIGSEHGQALAGEIPVGVRDREPVARVADRRVEQPRPGQAAMRRMHHLERRERARHRDAARPAHRHAGGEPLRQGGGGRRTRAVIDLRRAAPSQVGVIERVAAEARHMRLDHEQRGGDRHGGVERVAAAAQRVEPGLRRQRVIGADRAAPSHDERSVAACEVLHRCPLPGRAEHNPSPASDEGLNSPGQFLHRVRLARAWSAWKICRWT